MPGVLFCKVQFERSNDFSAGIFFLERDVAPRETDQLELDILKLESRELVRANNPNLRQWLRYALRISDNRETYRNLAQRAAIVRQRGGRCRAAKECN
jgi:hypothetical protein